MVYRFTDDYSEGAHPLILEALTASNAAQQSAYGDDAHSHNARRALQKHLDGDAAIHFVASGTLANAICIASCLRPHEAVIAAQSAHIAQHETGAIEATGHKIISVPTDDGKLTVAAVRTAVERNTFAPHMAKPRLVYLSNATELGTVYTGDELSALSQYCRQHNLLLMLDGARLGVALASTTLSLKAVAANVDLFWIGGTKCGALLGEAIVIPNSTLATDFAFHIKQRGGLLSKGRVLGVQFETLFEQSLYIELATTANAHAHRLSEGLIEKGYRLLIGTQSNQVFPILPNDLVSTLRQHFAFHTWQAGESETAIRLVTSWATDTDKIIAFLASVPTKR
ncbi:MAG: aminotransferase class I/II-fold pyridoxal phosphate-dependent enzyme [Pseudomonadota bacterium]